MLKRPARFCDYPASNALSITVSSVVLILFAPIMMLMADLNAFLFLAMFNAAFLMGLVLGRAVLPEKSSQRYDVIVRAYWSAGLFAGAIALYVANWRSLEPDISSLSTWLFAHALILPVIAAVVAAFNQNRRFHVFAFHDSSDHVIITLKSTVTALLLCFVVSRYGVFVEQSADPAFAALLIKAAAFVIYPALLYPWLNAHKMQPKGHSAQEW